MNTNKSDLYLQKYAQELIQIDAFAADKMGIIQSQTMLKIDNLQLVCSPFQISMQRAILLCVLSEQELPFFLHYKQKLTALKLSFAASEFSREPIKLMVWTNINQLIPLKGKQNLCMIDLSYKKCPDDLIVILGKYLDLFKQYQNLFIKYKNKEIVINPETSKHLKFNNYAEASIKTKKAKVKLLSLAVNRLLIILPAIDPDIKAGFEFELKLFFQTYRFPVKGAVAELFPAADKLLKLGYTVKFTPELVDIVHDYFIRTG